MKTSHRRKNLFNPESVVVWKHAKVESLFVFSPRHKSILFCSRLNENVLKEIVRIQGGNEEHYHSGVLLDKEVQRKSLQWIREQSTAPNCMESLDTHDNDIKPHVIEL